MEMNKEITNKLHQVEPSIWEELHDIQNKVSHLTEIWEKTEYADKFRFAKRINEMTCPIIVYNIKLGCYTEFLHMDSGIAGTSANIRAIGINYADGWNIDDCLFFYELDGYKICEGVDGFIRKKRIYATGNENIPWHCPDIQNELEMISFNASWLSLAVARNIGGGFIRISEMRSHEEEIKRICEYFEIAREKFFTGLRNADIKVF